MSHDLITFLIAFASVLVIYAGIVLYGVKV